MKSLLPMLYWLWPCLVIAQAKEVSFSQNPDTAKAINRQAQPYKPASPAGKPEIFTSGYIDIVNNGQVNASTRFVLLFILTATDRIFGEFTYCS